MRRVVADRLGLSGVTEDELRRELSDFRNLPLSEMLAEYSSFPSRRSYSGFGQQCMDRATGKPLDARTLGEITYGSKLAMLAYLIPTAMPQVAHGLGSPNKDFLHMVSSVMASNGHYMMEDYVRLLLHVPVRMRGRLPVASKRRDGDLLIGVPSPRTVRRFQRMLLKEHGKDPRTIKSPPQSPRRRAMTDEVDGVAGGVRTDGSELSGFMVRTPLRVYHDAEGGRQWELPPWSSRHDLLDRYVTGGNTAYVMRRNLDGGGHECVVMFRGTVSDLNGIHQYGRYMGNTQAFRKPDYDPVSNRFVRGGSRSVPLFMYCYASMADDLKPHIYQMLRWLGAHQRECRRILWCGHSMGGAMVNMMCYLLRHDDPAMWHRSEFRAFGSPMVGNRASVRVMSQWMEDAGTRSRYLEVVNTDDFVNMNYQGGGPEGLKISLSRGKMSLLAWLTTYREQLEQALPVSEVEGLPSPVDRMIRVTQVLPDAAAAAFSRGVMEMQGKMIVQDGRAAHRMGMVLPTTASQVSQGVGDDPDYEDDDDIRPAAPARRVDGIRAIALVSCSRVMGHRGEFLDKSHLQYMDLETGPFSSSHRRVEMFMYEKLHSVGLGHPVNRLVVVPLAMSPDWAGAHVLARRHEDKYNDTTEEVPRMVRPFFMHVAHGINE